jgi:hypothetical protein
MKRTLLTLLLALFLCSTHAQEFKFADIPWYSSSSHVKAVMAGRGYNFGATEAYGTLAFYGTLFGKEATVVTSFNHFDELVKTEVYVFIADAKDAIKLSEVSNLYHRLRDNLISKYGKPQYESSFGCRYAFLYGLGQGQQEQTLSGVEVRYKLSQNPMYAIWEGGARARGYLSSSIKVDEWVYLWVNYQSAKWELERARRLEVEARDF